MIDRRRFLLISLAAPLAAPLVVEAQPATTMPRLGYLFFGTSGSDPAAIEGLRQGLRGFGYIEKQNAVIEYRYADGDADRLPRLVTELIDLKVDVLITQGAAAAAAAKRVTTTTPVVFVALDPVGSGLVQSLARPGGNITGLSLAQAENFTGKWLALVKDIAPRATRVGLIWNPSNPSNATDVNRWKPWRRDSASSSGDIACERRTSAALSPILRRHASPCSSSRPIPPR